MKSTLYLKFIIIYMIFGFMSLFTVATLTRTLTEEPLERDLAADVYQEANLVAMSICHIISLDRLMKVLSIHNLLEWKRIWTGSLVRRPGR